MARFKVSLRLAWDIALIPARKWSNTFYLEAANPSAAAAGVVTGWTTYLRNAARTTVYAYEVYASDIVPLTDNYVVQTIPTAQARGSLAVPAADQPYLPKVCIAVPLQVPGSRPSRKFWRPGLYETDITNGVSVGSGMVNAINTSFSQFIGNLGAALVDVDGQPITTVGPLRLTTREFGRESTNLVPAPAS